MQREVVMGGWLDSHMLSAYAHANIRRGHELLVLVTVLSLSRREWQGHISLFLFISDPWQGQERLGRMRVGKRDWVRCLNSGAVPQSKCFQARNTTLHPKPMNQHPSTPKPDLVAVVLVASTGAVESPFGIGRVSCTYRYVAIWNTIRQSGHGFQVKKLKTGKLFHFR